MTSKDRREARRLRKARIRRNLGGVYRAHPRVSVFRSDKHIYAQIIDDQTHQTVVAVSTLSKELKGTLKKTSDVEAAKLVGKLLAEKAKEKKVAKLSFDRNGYNYHGRVKALANAAREAGLKF